MQLIIYDIGADVNHITFDRWTALGSISFKNNLVRVQMQGY